MISSSQHIGQYQEHREGKNTLNIHRMAKLLQEKLIPLNKVGYLHNKQIHKIRSDKNIYRLGEGKSLKLESIAKEKEKEKSKQKIKNLRNKKKFFDINVLLSNLQDLKNKKLDKKQESVNQKKKDNSLEKDKIFTQFVKKDENQSESEIQEFQQQAKRNKQQALRFKQVFQKAEHYLKNKKFELKTTYMRQHNITSQNQFCPTLNLIRKSNPVISQRLSCPIDNKKMTQRRIIKYLLKDTKESNPSVQVYKLTKQIKRRKIMEISTRKQYSDI